MTEIALLCPTRRPDGLRRLYDSALGTCDSLNWRLYAYVDERDRGLFDGRDFGPLARIVYGRELVLSDYWNALAHIAQGDILGMLGDDVEFRSQGWDTLLGDVFGEYPDRILFAFGWDGFRNETHGSHGFVSRQWVDALGRFTTPDFSHDYADTWMNDVARAVGRWRYVDGLVTRHWHPDDRSLGVVRDHVYVEGCERGVRDNCAGRFETPEWRAEISEYAERLRTVML